MGREAIYVEKWIGTSSLGPAVTGWGKEETEETYG